MVWGMAHARPQVAPDEIVLAVAGMSCRHCVRAVSIHLRDVAGVLAVEADLRSRTVWVVGTPDVQAVVRAVADAGYEVASVAPAVAPTTSSPVPPAASRRPSP